MNFLQFVCFIIAIGMIAVGVMYPIPEKHISLARSYDEPTWSDSSGEEYVGGDAYNYQIEASLKSGYLSSVVTLKVMMFCGGMLLLALDISSCIQSSELEKQTQQIDTLIRHAEYNSEIQRFIADHAQSSANVLEAIYLHIAGNSPINND